MGWRWCFILLLVVVLPVAAWVTPSGGAAGPRIALGVNLDGVPGSPAALAQYVREVGRRPAAIMWYQDWSGPLATYDQLRFVNSVGACPIVTWLPELGSAGIPLSAIARGDYDGYLRRSAELARDWGRPLYIRFAHEMNLPKSRWGVDVNGNTAADYVAAWRHVVTAFRQDGATNVRWVWSPEVEQEGLKFAPFYPGNRWVDWVALDGYNWGTAEHHQKWEGLAAVFLSSYRELARLSSRPVMIGEVASTEVGGSKADWIRTGLLDVVPRLMPRVRAVVWFDRDKEADWRIDSSLGALSAFRSVVHTLRYQAVLP
jgi:hypothetical protein